MSLYNEDELTPSSWINSDFLEKVLKKYENNPKIQIICYDICPACMKGDHYASVMFRCKVTYKSSADSEYQIERSMIIKTLPEQECVKRELLQATKLFETEIEMFSKTLRKLENILDDHGQTTKLSAGLIYYALEPNKVIIFEDLCELGYDTIRNRLLTEEDINAVLCKLAKFHAASYLLANSEESQEVSKYHEHMFNMSAEFVKDLLGNGIKHFLELLRSKNEFSTYYEKVKEMEPLLEEKCKELYNAYEIKRNVDQLPNQPKDIFVLNHGDFHMKNLMFKFNQQNQLEDVLMVDYQICVFAPMTIDLVYSHYMILTPELRLKRQEFMRFYFTQFVNTLKNLKFNGDLPKYADCQMSFLKYRYFSIFLMSTFLPMSYVITKTAEELKDTNADTMMEDQDTMKNLYYSPEYLNDLRRLLPVLLDEGYLD